MQSRNGAQASPDDRQFPRRRADRKTPEAIPLPWRGHGLRFRAPSRPRAFLGRRDPTSREAVRASLIASGVPMANTRLAAARAEVDDPVGDHDGMWRGTVGAVTWKSRAEEICRQGLVRRP